MEPIFFTWPPRVRIIDDVIEVALPPLNRDVSDRWQTHFASAIKQSPSMANREIWFEEDRTVVVKGIDAGFVPTLISEAKAALKVANEVRAKEFDPIAAEARAVAATFDEIWAGQP
jgi:hypothetical protein